MATVTRNQNSKHLVTEWIKKKKNLESNQAQPGLLWPTNEQCMIMNDSGSITGHKSDWIACL